jgi:hypothetical protein
LDGDRLVSAGSNYTQSQRRARRETFFFALTALVQ